MGFCSSLEGTLSRAVEFSLALPAGALIALVWANTALDSYERFAHAFEFPRLGWRDLTVAAITAGIGFTVALFFTVAAFPGAGSLLAQSKMGALLSIAAAPLTVASAATLGVGRFRASARDDP